MVLVIAWNSNRVGSGKPLPPPTPGADVAVEFSGGTTGIFTITDEFTVGGAQGTAANVTRRWRDCYIAHAVKFLQRVYLDQVVPPCPSATVATVKTTTTRANDREGITSKEVIALSVKTFKLFKFL